LQLAFRRWGAVGGASLLVAMAQSLCTAVLTISGIRVAIGLSALAAASGVYAPARGFHQDAIRIPMLILATLGAIVNLAVLAWTWHLRSRPSAQWRRRERSPKEKRSEKLQVAMAILTLILVGLETWTHARMHRSGPPPASAQSIAQPYKGQVPGLAGSRFLAVVCAARINTASSHSPRLCHW
jgi:formate hydrogenlyase subunit 3/multisubunit Na+/H+ antiporter MnhD subunit